MMNHSDIIMHDLINHAKRKQDEISKSSITIGIDLANASDKVNKDALNKVAEELKDFWKNFDVKENNKMENNVNTKVVIYHHNDADGRVSGLIIKNWLKAKGYENILLASVNYDVCIDFDNIENDTLVYFLDYSFTNSYNLERLKILMLNNPNLVWIDHHESSLKILEDPNFNSDDIIAKVNTNNCAAYMCWGYVHELDSAICQYHDFIKYIDSWDTWKHNMPNTEEFHIGMQSRYDEIDEALRKYFAKNNEHDICFDKIIVDSIHEGSIIKKHTAKSNDKKVNATAFPSTIKYKGNEYRCLVANFPIGNSTYFGDKIEKYDIVILFYFNGATFTHSLYSINNDINCAEICETFNNQFKTVMSGGGHKGAAGFTSSEMFFKEESVIHLKDQSRFFKPGDYVISYINDNINGETYRIARITTDFITKEKTVIFHLVPNLDSDKNQKVSTLSLPLKDFVSEVDKEKYPNCDHKYMFEKVKQ